MANYLIGIDGGGSKTDFLLCDLDLNEVARHFAGRSNPNDIGIDNASELIISGVGALCEKAGVNKNEVKAAFAGIAGASSKDYITILRDSLQKALPRSTVGALHDGVNVLYGAFPYEDGVCVICGTGSSCFIKKQGYDMIRIGGYGALDLTGNGYEIGRTALAHALKTVDGREKEGAMESLLHKKFGNDFLASLETMLALTKTETASLAPLVFESARLGDKNAYKIIDENISYIASLIRRAGDFFEGDYKVALAGGILNDGISVKMLREKTDSRVTLIKSDTPPSFGAAARAKQLLTE